MHNIKINNIYTDLAIELNTNNNQDIVRNNINGNNYVTIRFNDITDYSESKKVENIMINELNNILKKNKISANSSCFVIGLGNINSTPDSLGPKVIENIIVTSHLKKMNALENGFREVSTFIPSVTSKTGIETSDLISSIVKKIKPDFIIVIDALKASKKDNLNKIIQISDAGINPGSGIGNNRKKINKKNMKVPVISIGVPTVINIDNLIVCNIDIDSFIEKISISISNSINRCLHKNVENL